MLCMSLSSLSAFLTAAQRKILNLFFFFLAMLFLMGERKRSLLKTSVKKEGWKEGGSVTWLSRATSYMIVLEKTFWWERCWGCWWCWLYRAVPEHSLIRKKMGNLDGFGWALGRRAFLLGDVGVRLQFARSCWRRPNVDRKSSASCSNVVVATFIPKGGK